MVPEGSAWGAAVSRDLKCPYPRIEEYGRPLGTNEQKSGHRIYERVPMNIDRSIIVGAASHSWARRRVLWRWLLGYMQRDVISTSSQRHWRWDSVEITSRCWWVYQQTRNVVSTLRWNRQWLRFNDKFYFRLRCISIFFLHLKFTDHSACNEMLSKTLSFFTFSLCLTIPWSTHLRFLMPSVQW